MATPSSSSAYSGSSRYDVFLSFRGEDTRTTFTGHLRRALIQQGIQPFCDDDSLRKGEDLGAVYLRAIDESRICIIILSENYAASRWCLEELAHIIDHTHLTGHLILPVFYKVKPSDVRHQRGKWAEAIAKHEARVEDVAKVERWRRALEKVANMSGFLLDNERIEAELVDEIVKEVSDRVLNCSDLYVANHPVGIEARVHDVVKLLRVGGDDVHMVGIWGLAGIGKTTVAKAVYNSIKQKFDGSCFLENIREAKEQEQGLVGLQSLLVSEIRRGYTVAFKNVSEGIHVIERQLRNQRILLVLDDVDGLEHLESLAGEPHWFGPGSRVIITTRDRHLLIRHQVSVIYEVGSLDHHESLKLFSYNCFQKPGVPMVYRNLAIDAVQYAEGLPLALIVLGSFLYGRSVEEWEEARDGNWKVGTTELYETFRRSYDALDHLTREVFLDIACFFKGENSNHVKQLLEGMYPTINIRILQEIALISINDESHIWMHNWVEAMGKTIVYNESPKEPSERSRLWEPDDVYNVLTQGSGTNKVKGIIVKLPEPDETVLSATSFLGMQNLKYFINCHASFSGYIDYLPDELRLIDWPGFPFESLPINFSPRKLVKLNMPCSRISRLWERFKCSKNLVYLNLEGCLFLTELPDFSAFSKLKCLNLCNCSSLTELDDSVGFLDKLEALNLSGCSKLIKFPRRVTLKSVRYITLRGCSMLKSFPEVVNKMKWLKSLDLSGTAIKELPSPIGFLNSLEELTMRECDNLTNLPCSIYELQNLWSLDLQDCLNLVNFPKWTAEFMKGLTKSPDLCFLNLCGCKRLQEIPELPPNVKWVNSANCSALERFAKLSNILEREESQMIKCISLLNCRRLCESLSKQMEQTEKTLLNEVSLCSIFLSCKDTEFDIVFPGTEVPKWFKHRQELEELVGTTEFQELKKVVGTTEFPLEIPVNFKSGDIGLAICAATSVYGFGHHAFPATSIDDFGHCSFTARIDIQEESAFTRSFRFEAKDMESAHVWLLYIPLVKFVDCQSPPKSCRVSLEHTSQGTVRCKSYGVHLIMPQVENEDKTDENLEDYYSASGSDEDMKDE